MVALGRLLLAPLSQFRGRHRHRSAPVGSRGVVLALAGLLLGCGGEEAPPAPAGPPGGTYTGTPRCTGADRSGDGALIDRFESSPRATVRLDAGGPLQAWTYIFLGDRDTVVESMAVRPGETFNYEAGQHIRKPGRTTVTVLSSDSVEGERRLSAALDWVSPSTGYLGTGGYTLRLEPKGPGAVEYQAEKTVVKVPRRDPSSTEAVVRRTESCIGQLRR